MVFIWPLLDLSFSKNDHFSPPLDSLRSWVLSARSEVLAYYTVEAVPSTQWRKSNGFQLVYKYYYIVYDLQWQSLFSLLVFFSRNYHFYPPLYSLRSWVLSARLEVLAYYIVEAVLSTRWKKNIGFHLYGLQWHSLFSLSVFFSKKDQFSPPVKFPT